MSEMVAKARRAMWPIVIGWILTVWMPVPHLLHRTVSTAAAAAANGWHAIVATVASGFEGGAERPR